MTENACLNGATRRQLASGAAPRQKHTRKYWYADWVCRLGMPTGYADWGGILCPLPLRIEWRAAIYIYIYIHIYIRVRAYRIPNGGCCVGWAALCNAVPV